MGSQSRLFVRQFVQAKKKESTITAHNWSFVRGIHLSQVHTLHTEPVMSWWRHQMDTFSVSPALCAENSPVTGEFPAQRPVTRSFDVFFDLCLNKRLSKNSWGWWFETPSRPLWRQCNGEWHFYVATAYFAGQSRGNYRSVVYLSNHEINRSFCVSVFQLLHDLFDLCRVESFRGHLKLIRFSVFSPHQNGTGNWNPSSRKKTYHLPGMVSSIVPDDLATPWYWLRYPWLFRVIVVGESFISYKRIIYMMLIHDY